MSRSRMSILVAIILFSLFLASGVLAAAREDEAQLAPGSQVTRYQSLDQPGDPAALETGLQVTGVVTPTYVYPDLIQVPPPAPEVTPPVVSPAFVYPDLSQDSPPAPEATTPVGPTRVYPGDSQGPSSELAIDAFETHNCNDLFNPIANCSFETGNFAGWIADDMAAPFIPLAIYPAGATPGFGFFSTQPTQGNLVMAHGFDGAGPDQISLAQDVSLPIDSGYLRFDYRLAWDMYHYVGSTLNREFRVEVQPYGGGPALQSTLVYTAWAGTYVLDSGNLTGRVDVSRFAGQAVRIKFIWNVPEASTGPAFFQLDNIDIIPVPHDCSLGDNPIANCSFETGDFTGWIPDDIAGPFYPLGVYPAGVNIGFFPTLPSQGSLVMANGFDGAGPDQISLAQDVSLPIDSGYLRFDYRLAWDMVGYGATLNREFRVEVQPSGGGPALQTTTILTAPAGTNNYDSGNLTGRVDVRSFGGQDVRIKFIWNVPEWATGPAFFQLDNIDIVPIPHDCTLGDNPIANCSFETGDFTGWIPDDIAGPFYPLGVYPPGIDPWGSFFYTQPTQGSLVMANGFDGAGPDQISLAQDVSLPDDSGDLRFDYRLAWDLALTGTATLDREFRVEVQPYGGGPVLQTTVVYTAPAGSIKDSGKLIGHVDVRSFAGQDVRIKFIWNVPENGTGPAFFQLDNVDIVPIPHDCSLVGNPIVNCSFETGNFTGWIPEDMATPYYTLGIYPAGVNNGFFPTLPTQGSKAMANGFDGAGPDQISLAQDVYLPVGSDDLRFDYRLAWDIFGTLDREFRVEVQPSGGGPALQTTTILTAPAGTSNYDSGNLTGRVDMSSFAGQDVRIKFIWNVPETFTGPAFFQLDNVDIDFVPRVFLPMLLR